MYDADGNLTSDGTRMFTYDAENRLVLVEPTTPVDGGLRVKVAYDYLGRRVQKVQRSPMHDLNAMSYDQWCAFIFAHDPPGSIYSGQAPTDTPWHFDPEWSYVISSSTAVARLDHLFRNAERLPERFTLPQLDQGFWFISGPNGFLGSLLDDKVSWEARSKTIQAMVPLFERFFARNPPDELGLSGYMWWDSIASYCVLGDKEISSDTRIMEAVIEVITTLRKSKSPEVRSSADHGAEHFRAFAEHLPEGVRARLR